MFTFLFALCLFLLIHLSKSETDRYWCSVAPRNPEDRRPQWRKEKQELRFAHYNAYWLFLDQWDRVWTSIEQAEDHVRDVAWVLDQLDADVISLAEVEDCVALERLRAAMKWGNEYRYYLIRGTDTGTDQNVALMTRIDPQTDVWRTSAREDWPVAGNKCFKDAALALTTSSSSSSSSSGVSKHLFARLAPDHFPPLLLALAHLIAFPDRDERCAQREAQALVLADELLQLGAKYQDHQIIVAGDLNDFDGAVLDIRGSLPTSRVLQFLKSPASAAALDFNSTFKSTFKSAFKSAFKSVLKSTTAVLTNVAEDTGRDDRYTAYFDPSANSCRPPNLASSSIDHVLVSSPLFESAINVTFANHLTPPQCATSSPVSDHWPIYIEFKVNNKTKFL